VTLEDLYSEPVLIAYGHNSKLTYPPILTVLDMFHKITDEQYSFTRQHRYIPNRITLLMRSWNKLRLTVVDHLSHCYTTGIHLAPRYNTGGRHVL